MQASPFLTELDGTAWRAVRIGPGLAAVVPDGTEVSLQVDGERLSGRS